MNAATATRSDSAHTSPQRKREDSSLHSPAQRRFSRRRGSATLEFSLVLPLLISVALLCVDFGRFAYCYISVTNAVRAGAAYASVNLYSSSTETQWQTNVTQAVTDEFATNGWYSSGDLTVNTPQLIQESGGYWRVSVTASYSFSTLIQWGWLPGYNKPIKLSRTVVMRGTI
jgi:Flp pilus assembly protein TadG